MKVTITFRHMETSPGLREYVDNKVESLEKFLIKATEMHVILSVEKFRHRAEIVMFEQNFKASADETSDDMYKSIDSAMTKIANQLKKHKEKIQSHHKHHHGLHEVSAQAESEFERARALEEAE